MQSVETHLPARLRQILDAQARGREGFEVGVGQLSAIEVGVQLRVVHRRLINGSDFDATGRAQDFGEGTHVVDVGMCHEPPLHAVAQRREEPPQIGGVRRRAAVDHCDTPRVGADYVGVHLRRSLRRQLPKRETRTCSRQRETAGGEKQ